MHTCKLRLQVHIPSLYNYWLSVVVFFFKKSTFFTWKYRGLVHSWYARIHKEVWKMPMGEKLPPIQMEGPPPQRPPPQTGHNRNPKIQKYLPTAKIKLKCPPLTPKILRKILYMYPKISQIAKFNPYPPHESNKVAIII